MEVPQRVSNQHAILTLTYFPQGRSRRRKEPWAMVDSCFQVPAPPIDLSHHINAPRINGRTRHSTWTISNAILIPPPKPGTMCATPPPPRTFYRNPPALLLAARRRSTVKRFLVLSGSAHTCVPKNFPGKLLWLFVADSAAAMQNKTTGLRCFSRPTTIWHHPIFVLRIAPRSSFSIPRPSRERHRSGPFSPPTSGSRAGTESYSFGAAAHHTGTDPNS